MNQDFKIILDTECFSAPMYRNILHKIVCKILPWWFKPIYGTLSSQDGFEVVAISPPKKWQTGGHIK
jgi:hypothetical protein